MASRALWAALVASFTVVGGQPAPAESFNGPYNVIPETYNAEEPPSQGMVVIFSLVLKKLHDANAANNIVKVAGEITRYWYDPRLFFAGVVPGEMSRVESVAINPRSIWTPDVELLEKVDDFQGSCNQPRAVLFSDTYMEGLNGSEPRYNVFLTEVCVLTARCKLILTDFPFDRNTCNLTFAPWVDRSYTLVPANQSRSDLITQEYETEMGRRPIFGTRAVPMLGLPPREQSTLMYTLHIARFSRYYEVNLIAPLLLMVCLSWFVFFTPVNKSDRLAYSVTLLLAVMAVQFITADKRPPEEQDGWIDRFQVGVYILVIIPIMETAVLHRIEMAAELRGRAHEAHKSAHMIDRVARISYPILVLLFISAAFGPGSPSWRHPHRSTPDSPTILTFFGFWVPIMLVLFSCSVWNWLLRGPWSLGELREALSHAITDPGHEAHDSGEELDERALDERASSSGSIATEEYAALR